MDKTIEKSEAFAKEFNDLLIKNGFRGEILNDIVNRILYSTDASIYQINPKMIVIPRHRDDLDAVVQTASQTNTPITARGSGSGLAGQAIGDSVIVDTSRYLTKIIEIDPDNRFAVVEPGVILEELNRQAGRYNLQFGPDPASAERATLGGCIANNATGAHSIVYGMTSDHILHADVVLSDGKSSSFSYTNFETAENLSQSDDAKGNLYAASLIIRESLQEEIMGKWPNTWRRVSGYGLNYLLPWSFSKPPNWDDASVSWDNSGVTFPYPPVESGGINLAQLFAGSEGTLGIIKKATIRLVPKPSYTVLGVLAFETIVEACDAVPELLQISPSAIELIPKSLIDLAKSVPAYASMVNFTQQIDSPYRNPEALLVLEFSGDDPEKLRDKAAQLGGGAYIAVDPKAQKEVWDVRKVGLGILMSRPGSEKPVAFIEDMAVPVEKLGDFVRGINQILRSYNTEADYYAHASAGCLHIRPILNLKTGQGVDALRSIAEESVKLTLQMNGSISAEHGDGIARSEWIAQSYGPKITQAFKDIKNAADPKGIMNPGKIVDPDPMDMQLRFGEGYRPRPWQPVFAYPDSPTSSPDIGLVDAIEQCNGAGVCRKAGGVMCPSFQASLNEMHSTRGRANLLRAMISSQFETRNLAEKSVKEALDLCLACKGCKSECPSGVDVAKLKYEFSQYYYDKPENRRPVRDYLFGFIDKAAQLGYLVRPIANLILSNTMIRKMGDRYLGISSERQIPPIARKSLTSLWEEYIQKNSVPQNGERVLFLSDAFTEYFHPEAGFAALQLLNASGSEIQILPVLGAGRTLISKGLLKVAKKHAQSVIDAIKKSIDPTGSISIVSVEPSEIYTIRDEYVAFFPHDEYVMKLAANSFMIDEFLLRPNADGDLRVDRMGAGIQPNNSKIHLHGHCYQKAQPPHSDQFPSGLNATTLFLSHFGYDVEVIDAGCCGMAGAFGYEKEHYQFSQQVAELKLYPALRKLQQERNSGIVAASGVSCMTQVRDGVGCITKHPAELVLEVLDRK